MDCEQYRELFSEYLQGELEDETAEQVKEHIEACSECTKELAQYAKLDSVFAQLPVHEPSPESVIHVRSETVYTETYREKRTEFGEVMDVHELAEYLRITVEIIEEYISEIPCFELGGKLLFRKKSIEQWVEERERDFGFQKLDAEVDRILASQEAEQGCNNGVME